MAGSTQVICHAGRHPSVHNVSLAAESMSSTCLLSSHCKISLQTIAMFCTHTLKVHFLNRQVSQLAETDHTLRGAGML